MSKQRIELIKNKLADLEPTSIDIEDQGHLHVGHAGSKSGGHFYLRITSKKFKGLNMIQRHKIIYKCLEDLMKTDIHALSIKALEPNEDN